jgi:hypothetical protein
MIAEKNSIERGERLTGVVVGVVDPIGKIVVPETGEELLFTNGSVLRERGAKFRPLFVGDEVTFVRVEKTDRLRGEYLVAKAIERTPDIIQVKGRSGRWSFGERKKRPSGTPWKGRYSFEKFGFDPRAARR